MSAWFEQRSAVHVDDFEVEAVLAEYAATAAHL